MRQEERLNLINMSLKEENAKLRGALVEMLTAHGYRAFWNYNPFKINCKCHACENARKLLRGEHK